MLKDILKRKAKIILDERYGDKFPLQLRGELEIIGKKDGKIFHHDKGDNTVTIFGKHVMMHLLTGEIFHQYGITRTGTHGATDNVDGTQISGRQHFNTTVFPSVANGWWSRSTSGDSATHLYPFFPVKLLFGTGFEWRNWAAVVAYDTAYSTRYTSDGWTQPIFDTAASKDDATNNYSADYSGDTLFKNRSMNDIYSSSLTGVILDTEFAVKGAIKDGFYRNFTTDAAKIELVSGNYFSKKEYWGTGKPALVYARRDSRFNESGTEVALDFDNDVENKITFTVTLPEQTGVNAGLFYPYNGFILKQAGLFADARFTLRDTAPANDADSDDTGLTEFDNYTKMPYGIMFAKRNIAPITKQHSVSITARWTIYL